VRFTGPDDWTQRYAEIRSHVVGPHGYEYGDSGDAETDARLLVGLIDELRVEDP
jgi:hypothetical protein